MDFNENFRLWKRRQIFKLFGFKSANKQVQNHPYYGYQNDLRVGFIMEYGTL